MEKLTAEEIKFIDNYLKNSGVEFLDVRLEMTDHVASAIERDLEQEEGLTFYDAFKSYMIRNKKSLLENANKHRWSVDLKILMRVGENLFHPFGLIFILLFLITIYIFKLPELDNNSLFSVPFLIIILCGYLAPVVLYLKLKVSFLKRMTTVSYLLNYIFYLLITYAEFSQVGLYIFYGILFWVNISVIKTAFQMSSYYKKQYVGL